MALVAVVVITIIACDLAYGHLYNGPAISFFLSFFLSDLAFGGAWIAIDLAQWCSSFYRRRGRDGRVIVIAIIITTIIACDLPCL